MSGVDNRIVTMKFDNAQFETNARTSLSTLQKLKESMNFGPIGTATSKALGGISSLFSKFGIKNPFATAEKGAADLSKAAGGVASGGMTSLDGAVTGVSARFIAMSTIAITALTNIANSAFQTGKSVFTSLTVDPVKTGMEEYETKLNSIQTILANTEQAGVKLPDVNEALAELNEYSDKTIYNFANMTDAIAKFTRAGVDLDTSVSAIKGMANAAALGGAKAEDLARAYYQVSQEISAGRVSLMGWNSVENAGIASAKFKKALAETAVAMGELPKSAVTLEGAMENVKIKGESFRDSIMAKPGEVSWLSNKVLLGTLEQFTGDMSKAQIMAQGFTEDQARSIMATARTAMAAAQDVKTLTGVMDVAKETMASGWAYTWELIFGNFKEAKTLFTNFSNAFSGAIAKMADKRNALLEGWGELGGREELLDGLKTLWASVETILTPIKNAFRDIFPRTTSEELFALTEKFGEFAEKLAIGKQTMSGLRDTFGGMFAIFSIIGQVIGAVVHGISRLFGAIGEGSGGILDFTGGLGNLIKAFDVWLEKSGILKQFFGTLGDILAIPLKILSGIGEVLGSMFDSFDTSGAKKITGAMDEFGKKVEPLERAGETIGNVFEKIGEVLSNAGDLIVSGLANLGKLISGAITPETFEASLDVINTTLLGGIVLMLRKFFTGGLNVDLSGGLFDGIKETLGATTGALKSMQQQVKADVILKIAIALGVLTAALLVLSMIDGKKLAKAMAAMGAGFGVLSVVLITLAKAITFIGMAKLPVISAAMVGIATALLIFATALKILSTIDLKDMIKGLFGLAGMLFILSKAVVPLSVNSGGMIRAAVALTILAVAMGLLAIALKIMASMSWEELARGLVGVAGALIIFAAVMRLMPRDMIAQAAAITLLGIAMNVLAVALKIFASMSWLEMAKGMAALASSLGIIAIAMRLMPKGMLLQAVALNAVATAMVVLSGALKIMGSMGWEQIAKGLVTLAGALLIIAVGLQAIGIVGTIGAVGLLAAAGALAILAPILITLGTLTWETIVKGLTALAGIFVVIGVAGYLLTPVIPTILALGAAFVLFGTGLALAGAGALAAATAFGIVAAAGTAGVEILVGILAAFIASIPAALAALGRGMVAFMEVIAKNGPAFTDAMDTMISSMLKAAKRNIPKFGKVFRDFVDEMLKTLKHSIPAMVVGGYEIVIGVLEGIERKLPGVIRAATNLAITFIRELGKNGVKFANAAFDVMIDFLRGLERAIEKNSDELNDAGIDLAEAIATGMIDGLKEAGTRLKDAAVGAAKDALQAAKDWLLSKSPSKRARDWLGKPIPQGMALGIEDQAYLAENAAVNMGQTALGALRKTMEGLSDVVDLDPSMHPVITPVLDLTALTQEANKMNQILAVAPIMAGVSYQTAADISAMTQAAAEAEGGPDAPGSGGGDTYVSLEQNIHSPKPIDSVETYRGGKTLIALAKEALS